MKPAATWQADYSASSGKAQTNWAAGIQATTKDWASLTAAAVPRMVSNFNAAAAAGTIVTGINNAGTGYWKSQSANKAGAFGLGITNGANAYGIAANKLYQYYTGAVPALPARGDINQNLQRANTLALALHQNKGNFRGKA